MCGGSLLCAPGAGCVMERSFAVADVAADAAVGDVIAAVVVVVAVVDDDVVACAPAVAVVVVAVVAVVELCVCCAAADARDRDTEKLVGLVTSLTNAAAEGREPAFDKRVRHRTKYHALSHTLALSLPHTHTCTNRNTKKKEKRTVSNAAQLNVVFAHTVAGTSAVSITSYSEAAYVCYVCSRV